RLKPLRGHLLHALDQVLARPASNEPHRNEAISLKKLLKGDGSWNTRKLILGWIVDTIRQTIELPPHRKETLAQIFKELSRLKRVNAKKWASYLGKLRFVSVAIPGSAGLFSALQWAQNKAKGNRIRVNRFVRDSLSAFSRLATSLCERPTRLAEIVPQDPTLLGATDAAKAGMGGVYFDASGEAYVWRQPFPEVVQRRLVSADHPSGDITNSDLEHAGLLAQVDVMATTHDIRYCTLEDFSDNTPAVSRVTKGAVSTPGAAAGLCRYQSDHQRLYRYCHKAQFLPGDSNGMADDASRLQHLTDADFLALFQQKYPQPRPWHLVTLEPKTASQLTSALLCKSQAPPTLRRRTLEEPKSLGSGQPSATPSMSILASTMSACTNTRLPTSSCLGSATARKDRKVNLSSLLQSRTPFWRWGRGYPTWANRIPAKNFLEETGTIPYSKISLQEWPTPTTLPSAPILPMSPSSASCMNPLMSITPATVKPTAMSSTSPLPASTGSCVLSNTPFRPTPPKPSLRPSASVTSPSRSSTPTGSPKSYLPLTHL
ncbi:MAG: hypothetical protein LC687_02190, partial [Actinobacteria bacterium]|nr:hypothetical protein [Actinomycetota bacterium]